MRKMKRVNFRDTPKVLKKIRVSFTVNGERVTFTKVQRVPKRIGKKYFVKRRIRCSLSTEASKPLDASNGRRIPVESRSDSERDRPKGGKE